MSVETVDVRAVRSGAGAGAGRSGGADVRPEARPEPGPRGAVRARARLLTSPALRTHLGTVAGAAILVVLLWRLGTGVFLDGLRRIDTPTLAAALAIGVVTTVCSAWRWQLVARGLRIRLPLGPAVADYYRALFLNAALPGGVLGDVHRAVRHGRNAGDLGRGVRTVVWERVAGQIALAVTGVTVLLTLPSPVRTQARHLAAPAALAVVGALAVLLALRLNRAPSARGRALRRTLDEAREALLSRRNGPGVALSSAVVLAGHLAMFVVAARVAGSAASVAVLLPLAILALLAMGLPLNVGGFGPREGVTAWAFGAAGLGAGTGLAVAVVYGVLSFVASLPGALVLLARWYTGLRAGPHDGGVESLHAGPDFAVEPLNAGLSLAVAEPPHAGPGFVIAEPLNAGSGPAVAEALRAGTRAAGTEPGPGGTAGGGYPRRTSRSPSPSSSRPLPVPAAEIGESTGASAEVSSEKYGPKEAARLASSSFPFSADPREGRPMTPDAV